MHTLKKGFTLAEVLITLLIVGVIASIVIPGLIADSQQAELKTAWKKAYADFNQVYLKIKVDNGTIKNLLSNCTNNDHSCFKNALKPYFNIVKECDAGNAEGNCFLPYSNTKLLSGGTAGPGYLNTNLASGLVLANGINLILFLDRADCSFARTATFIDECGWASIDVNGFKGPNTRGKDIFSLYINSNSISPHGKKGDGLENDCNTNPPSGSGYGCSAKYLYQ
jgi:prepilin-type N-terminal cleavage/methylation domain-containing protein